MLPSRRSGHPVGIVAATRRKRRGASVRFLEQRHIRCGPGAGGECDSPAYPRVPASGGRADHAGGEQRDRATPAFSDDVVVVVHGTRLGRGRLHVVDGQTDADFGHFDGGPAATAAVHSGRGRTVSARVRRRDGENSVVTGHAVDGNVRRRENEKERRRPRLMLYKTDDGRTISRAGTTQMCRRRRSTRSDRNTTNDSRGAMTTERRAERD